MVVFVGSSLVHAQGDMEAVRKSMELLEKMKVFESELRAETEEKIAIKRERAAEDLENVIERVLTSGEVAEAALIMNEISRLREKKGEANVVKPKVDKDKPSGDSGKGLLGNKYFLFKTDYLFKEDGVIAGKLIFRPQNKVRAVYKYKGKEVVNTWEWKEIIDHIEVETEGALGTIIISERPSSNLKSLLIRWGGELTNVLTDANANTN
ncbi:MAG: hypothetical protein ACSHX6_14605 [Akkermansiaceae bacterium]